MHLCVWVCVWIINSYMANDNEKKNAPNANQAKAKVSQTDKYYKIKADFGYLASYNYKITKEIGRGGYGVVYKVVFTSYVGDKHVGRGGGAGVRDKDKLQHGFAGADIRVDGVPAAGEEPGEPAEAGEPVRAPRHHAHRAGVLQVQALHRTPAPMQTFFNTFSLEEVKHYVLELLIGLKNLKDLGIYHRDIKPGNFLYNPDTRKGMIIDFGLAEIDPKFQAQLEQKYARLKEEKKEVGEL